MADVKEELEVQKLRAEIDQIARPFWKNPTIWIAAITLGIAVPGSYIQWVTNTIRFERAELVSQQNLKEVREQLETARQEIEREKLKARQELEATKSEAR